jgi:hypothetical protein
MENQMIFALILGAGYWVLVVFFNLLLQIASLHFSPHFLISSSPLLLFTFNFQLSTSSIPHLLSLIRKNKNPFRTVFGRFYVD